MATATGGDQKIQQGQVMSRDIDIQNSNKRKKGTRKSSLPFPPLTTLPLPPYHTMFANRFQILLTLAVAAAGVSAQAGLDTCILTCLQNASKATGSCPDMCDVPVVRVFFCL